jgi:7-cyano-7-deazaguanine tRNA-ribosyltransferase
MFEILKGDLAARIGILHTNHGPVQTPAFVPVVHPVSQSIAPQKLKKMGFELVITNAYITLNRYGEEAVRRGIHNIINFDGAVMTDSGGYQVLEYGKVNVTSAEMAEFEKKIMTDIAIPLDRPTGYGLPRKKAVEYVDYTLKISKETLDDADSNGQIWCGPIQGAEHSDLVKRSTRSLLNFGYKMLALGSPVEVMESYEYRILANMILQAKKLIPASVPLHLFGAGHPLTIPIAVALGCDTFDSASYMLYAKHDRYIMDDRTAHISEMQYFACPCEVCSKYSPRELEKLEREERINQIALHNLYSIKAEVDRVRQAIHEGRLWEYTVKKIRAHPKLYETLDVFVKNSAFFAKTTPRFKERAMFLSSPEDQFRPELYSYRNMVSKFRSGKKKAIVVRDSQRKPYYLSDEYKRLQKRISKDTQVCIYNPFFGIIPLELSDMYPASHHVMSDMEFRPEDFTEFAKSWKKFFSANKFSSVKMPSDKFLKSFKVKSKMKKKKD